MKPSCVLAIGLILSPLVAQGRRVALQTSLALPDSENTTDLPCCCKKDFCGAISKSTSTTHPVYSPNYGLCCKQKTWSCGSIMNWRTKYKIAAATPAFCVSPQSQRFDNPDSDNDESPLEGPVESGSALQPVEGPEVSHLEEGTPEHTVNNYCQFDEDEDVEDEEDEIKNGKASDDAASQAKAGVIKALVQELAGPSLDSMAKDIFSMYVCVRWAPTPAFVKAAKSEQTTEHLDSGSVYEHFDAFTFIPLRCSKNVNVYGHNPKLGETHFAQFERKMLAQSAWYTTESKGVVPQRLKNMMAMSTENLEEAAAAFDVNQVRKAVAECEKNGGGAPNITVDTMTVSSSKLLGDCAAAKWWLEKLDDWHHAMPFTSFMSPAKEVATKAKPKSDEHVLVCFGKRVAGQLHRRADGDHLITDQSMVGCHGFWKFDMAAKMLDRIVKLWKPPTCQLASMELDMKVKIMEMIARMNTQLFDALPAMLDDEAAAKDVDEDGVPLESASAPGVFMGAAKSIGSLFSSMSSKYVRLGQMLGGTVVKWVVCPMKPVTDAKDLEKLDMALGTEDDITRYYAKTAYKKWTGKKNLLPGEQCEAYDVDELPRKSLQRCSVGEMRENMPEKYFNIAAGKDEEFLCPVLPLLPAKQQLKILQQKNDLCPIRMDVAQMDVAKWFYRGRRPHAQQYDVMSTLPQKHFQYVKLLDMSSKYDATFYISRTFVKIGRGCTEEEAALTPRFCSKPAIGNKKTVVRDLLTGMAVAGGAVTGGVGKVLQAAGVTEETPPNKAYGPRIMSWLSGRAKSSERWLRSSTDSVLGRSKGRYSKLHSRMFAEVEAAELLHSMSFQSKMKDTGGDAKHNKRFDRFAVMSPCGDFDPNVEFRLKYTWTEKLLNIARKAFQKVQSIGTSSGGIKVQVRSDAVLWMTDAENAYVHYFAHFRASNLEGGAFSKWLRTNNPHILDVAGIFDGHSDASVKVEDLLGFEVTFVCGTRTAMHDLSVDSPSLAGSFRDCVKEGKTTNAELREKSADMPFLKDEVVVRATFKPISACHKDFKPSATPEEIVNPVYKNFAGITGCEHVDGGLPTELENAKTDSTYRGMLLGKGLPLDTLLEVLVDPEDFLQEVTL